MNQLYKNMMTLALGMLVLLAVFSFWSGAPAQRDELGYSEFLTALDDGRVLEVEISGETIEGLFQSGTRFITYAPVGDEHLMQVLRDQKVRTSIRPRDEGGAAQLSSSSAGLDGFLRIPQLITPQEGSHEICRIL